MISKMLDVYAKIQNDNHIVKINYRICKDKLSLYMSYRKTVNSQTINKRKSLNIFLTGNKKEDLNKIEFAMNIRNEFEKNLGSGLKIFQNDSERIFLVDYAKALSLKYTNVHSRKNISAVASHLKKFGCIITLSQVDKKFILDFMNYLDNSCPKAASFYFTKFKQVLYRAISDEIIPDIPFLRKCSIKQKKPIRAFLTEEELIQFKNFPHENLNYKNAFIFACFTGLRFVDLFKLTFDNVSNNYLTFIQEKTKEMVSMKLHKEAIRVVEDQKIITGREEGLLFDINSYESWRVAVLKMMKEAGISKHITGHCARHTFATLCLTYEIPITTIAKLLGHTDIKHTQAYAKLVDKKKDEAIDKLPDLE